MTDQHVNWLYGEIYDRFVAAARVKEGFRRWRAEGPDEDGDVDISADNPPRARDPDVAVAIAGNEKIAAHIAMNDPQSVMATCRAELDIVVKHTDTLVAGMVPGAVVRTCPTCRTPYYPCPTIGTLHAAYSNRPGWQPW